MFNLEKTIQTWKRKLRSNPAFEDGDIAELESHLREEIVRLKAEGLSEEEAFQKASEEIGEPESIGQELHKTRTIKPDATPPWKQKSWMPALFPNYLRVSFRNLKKNISHTTINVGGLSIGVVSALVIFLVIQFEFSYDAYHEDRDNIYRVVNEANQFNQTSYTPGVPAPLPEVMKNDFPEIETISIVDANFSTPVLTVERNDGSVLRFKEEDVAFVEQAYFEIFSYAWLHGSKSTALNRPGTVVISRSLAEKLYGGEEDVIGRPLIVQTGNKYDLKITGVIEDPPENTDLPFVLFVSYNTPDQTGEYRYSNNWSGVSSSRQCYLKLPDSITAAQINGQMDGLLGKFVDEQTVAMNDYLLQPLNELHFDTRFSNYSERTVAREILFALALIGLFLLGTAIINFVNLNTAVAVKRAKEVGVRKTLGGTRAQLMAQYLGETALIVLISLALALLLVGWAIPLVRSLMGIPLEFQLLTNIPLLLSLTGIFIVVTISAGLYPAIYLSGFNPVEAIKNQISASYGEGLTLRRSLVVMQFVISQVLIISAITISSQMRYFQQADMGFTKEALVEVPIPVREDNKLDLFKNELQNQIGIRSISYSGTSTASDNVWSGDYQLQDDSTLKEGNAHVKVVDENFLDTYGIELLGGKNLETSHTVNMYLVNEAFAREVGYADNYDQLIGKLLTNWVGGEAPIVGVVKNFHTTSLHEEIDPVLIASRPLYFTAGIKINMEQTQAALSSAEKAFEAAFPDYVFEYSFLEQRVADFYKREQLMARLMNIFTAIAILIGCLGLFGLVSYMAATRTKEIGVRKVMGATATDILKLFGKEFGLLMGISFLIAAPLAGYLMNRWLADFAYRIDLGPGLFIWAFAATLLIVVLTVGFKSLRTAATNPVESLKSE